MDKNFMKEKKIFPLVVSMSLPMVISMAVNSLYNIVDSYFVAKISEDAMTALSLVYPVQNLMTALAVGFGVGMNARIAYCLGANKQKGASCTAVTGLLLSAVHGIILMVVCLLGMRRFLMMYTDNESIINMGLEYSNRAFLFSVIIMLGISLEKIFQSVGKMNISMISMICGFVTNIILDPLMIFGIGFFPEMKMSGAAWATGIGQSVTLLVYIICLFISPIPIKLKIKNISFDKNMLKSLYSVGIPATLNMALPSFLISSLNGILAAFGEKYVLVLGAYYKLQTFIYLSANGIIQGVRPLVSFNYGALERERVKQIFKTTVLLISSVMALGVLLSLVIPKQLMGIFTSSPETVNIGASALRIICIGFVFSAVSVTCCGVLEALGRGMESLIISFMRYTAVIIPLAFLFGKIIGANGVFVAFPVTEIVTAVVGILVYRRNFKKCFDLKQK